MKTRALLAAGAAVLLAGLAACDGSAPPAPKEKADGATPVKMRNRPHEELLALPDNLRRVGLVRAIRDTGNECPLRVEPNPVHQGEYEGMAYWTARCDNNEQYAIFIAANEDVQVRNCRDMAELRLPPCRELPPARPDPERKARPKAPSAR